MTSSALAFHCCSKPNFTGAAFHTTAVLGGIGGHDPGPAFRI